MTHLTHDGRTDLDVIGSESASRVAIDDDLCSGSGEFLVERDGDRRQLTRKVPTIEPGVQVLQIAST